jgi:hypothetical protein
MSPAPWARWIFVGALAVMLALAIIWCAQAEPPQKLPTYALESATVWRLEILLAVFLGG